VVRVIARAAVSQVIRAAVPIPIDGWVPIVIPVAIHSILGARIRVGLPCTVEHDVPIVFAAPHLPNQFLKIGLEVRGDDARMTVAEFA
jgi:hypothetical protein